MTTRSDILALRHRVAASIVGQDHVVETLLVGLLADGHLLLEGLPGLAKTRAVKSLASNLEVEMHRVQFTPDLLPSDITGTIVYEADAAADARFRFDPGPIFANLVLVDEINRAPAKVQAALLEAMEERQVTAGGGTHALPRPFMVLATQNPIEQEGTYPLPEAQLDRFLMHVHVDYPDRDAEVEILRLVRGEEGAPAPSSAARLPAEAIFAAREEIRAVTMSATVEQYLVDLVLATRPPRELDEKLEAGDRSGRERLIKYVLRPPLAAERLERVEGGRVRLRLKREFRDGTWAIEMDELSLCARLAALVPPPWQNQIRYSGVLAPASKLRSRILPKPPEVETGDAGCEHARALFEPGAVGARKVPKGKGCRYWPWRLLKARTFGERTTACPECGGELRFRALVQDPHSILRILTHLGLPTDVPRPAPARGPPYYRGRVVRVRPGGAQQELLP